MNDGVVVSVLHRLADAPEKLEKLTQGSRVRLAMLSQRKAFRVLHHKPRSPVFERVGVVNARDGRMVQLRESQLLDLKPLAAHGGEPGIAQQLDRDLAADIGALGEVDYAHAALAQQAQQ